MNNEKILKSLMDLYEMKGVTKDQLAAIDTAYRALVFVNDLPEPLSADQIVGYIYESGNYDAFKKLDHNRQVTQKRFDKIHESISTQRQNIPITTDSYKRVGEGQGRFEVLKSMGLPIQYVVDPNMDIEACRRVNDCNSAWTLPDFIASYAEDGFESYKNIQYAMDATGLSPTTIITLSNHSKNSKDKNYSAIRNGCLVFTDDDLESVIDCFKRAKEIKCALCDDKRGNQKFYRAVKIMIDNSGYDHTQMIKNCARERGSYNEMKKLKAQLIEFSRIYNIGIKKPEKRIRFEDYMMNKGEDIRDYSKMNIKSKPEDKDISTLKGGK